MRKTSLANVVASEIRRALEERDLGAGGRLPTEQELATRYSVSRGTIREAITLLEDNGLVQRRQGAGTFVARGVVSARNVLNVNSGVTDLILAAGQDPGTSSIDFIVRPATAEESAVLATSPESDVLEIRRVRTADGRPVVAARDVVAVEVLAERGLTIHAVEAVVRSTQSIYEALRSVGITIHHGEAEIEPVAASATVARLLGVTRGTLLVEVRQVDFVTDDRPALLSDELHVAGAFSFRVYRKGPGG